MASHLLDKVGQWFGDDKPLHDLGDPIDFDSGPLLDYAISWVYIFKKLLIPRDYRMTAGKVRCAAVCENIKARNQKQRCKT